MARPATGQVVERKGAEGTTYALRFRAYGKRRYVTTKATSRAEAEKALAHTIADVERGIWQPSQSEPSEPIVAPEDEPTFHVYSSEWVERREYEVDARTAEHCRWALSNHLLPFFKDYRPSQITARLVDGYKLSKLRERELAQRKDKKRRGLSNSSYNKTLKVLAQILDDAIEDGYLDDNPARGKKRRLKARKPDRTFLELDEVNALIDAAANHRALVATMILAGLRVGELSQLRWRDVDLARGKLRVADSKTDAGRRAVDLSPWLTDELGTHKAKSTHVEPNDLVFGTRNRTKRNRSNITRQILAPAIERANAKLAEAELSPIEGVTNHSLRRTFMSLLYEAGASPAYVMA
jgi:integrase